MDESFAQYYSLINAQQQANNEWSAQQAQKAMDYQTEMSNTAHQREVADLKAAGLNPVLSAGGQGATTGTGHAANAGNENVTALYGMLSKLMDVQLEQAAALRNSAHAIDGSSGHSNSGYNIEDDELVDDMDKENKDPFHFGILDLPEDMQDTFRWIIRKVLHVSDKDIDKFIELFGDDPDKWPKLPLNNDKNNKMMHKKNIDHLNAQIMMQKEFDEQEKAKEEAKEKKQLPDNKKTAPSKKQKQEAATAVGLALAALIGKGLSGGSSKKIKDLVSAEMDQY